MSTEHKKNPGAELSVYGQEKVAETVRLGKMNLAVHGLAGDIRQGNTYYEDLHRSTGKFDFVMANPPFNVDRVDKDRLKDDPRFPFGLPRTDNANYLWIQLFYSALNDTGRAGFVMANSASDARGSELDIRKQLIEARAVDVMVAVGSNFFYTVTLPCTLWFFDRGKRKTARADKVLFIDARHIYRQIDRAHRDWTPAQIEFLANIARLYRGEAAENLHDSADLLAEHFAEEPNTPMWPGCARWRRWPRSKPRAGASTPAAMWVWPPAPRRTSTSRSGWRSRTRNWKPSTPRPGNWKSGSRRMWRSCWRGSDGYVRNRTMEEVTETLIDYRGKTAPQGMKTAYDSVTRQSHKGMASYIEEQV